MSEMVGGPGPHPGPRPDGVGAEQGSTRQAVEAGAGKRPRGRLALELMAVRGKDVVGARHVLDGGTAWVGNVSDAIARVPMAAFGGQPLIVAEASAGIYVLHVPPRARARIHGSDGIPRLVVGPYRIELREGERAVVVLGAVQIRGRVVPYEVSEPRFGRAAQVTVWLAVLAGIYAVALALSAAFSRPPASPRLDPGAMQRLHARFLPEHR
jgi:hypothetical protein